MVSVTEVLFIAGHFVNLTGQFLMSTYIFVVVFSHTLPYRIFNFYSKTLQMPVSTHMSLK